MAEELTQDRPVEPEGDPPPASSPPPDPRIEDLAAGDAEAAPAPPESVPDARLAPVAELERFDAVDTLRGFALLGILVINIYAFAMPFAAYANPLLYGGSTGINLGTWFATHLIIDQKFMTLFSMLFGAGLILMHQRAKARGTKFGGIYYRRELWLMLIGAAHGYLLWFGDILFHYAVCGMLLYPFRRRSPKTLIIIGVLLLLVALPLSTGMGTFMVDLRDTAAEAAARQERGEELDEEQQKALDGWKEMAPFMAPDAKEIARQVEVYRGGYAGILIERAPTVLTMQTFMTLSFIIWRVGGLMFLGMALMKLGVFSAARSAGFYRWCVGLGYGLGLPLAAYSAYDLNAHGFDGFYMIKIGVYSNYFASLAVGFGHLGVVMLVCKSGALPKLRARLAAVGRMALTNYLMHTILLTTVFYGYGLGLFGHIERFPQMAFVVAVLALELWWSPVWLRHFRFGPFEWLWRSLTYWRRQPMRRSR